MLVCHNSLNSQGRDRTLAACQPQVAYSIAHFPPAWSPADEEWRCLSSCSGCSSSRFQSPRSPGPSRTKKCLAKPANGAKETARIVVRFCGGNFASDGRTNALNSFVFRVADLLEVAFQAFRFARLAHFASMPN